MPTHNNHDVLSKAQALLSQLQDYVNEPGMLQAIIRQGNFAHVVESLKKEVARPAEASDHLTEEQVANAVEVCHGVVAAYIRGEDPGSISWEALDGCNELARKVIGQEGVHDMYRRLRPDKLEDYIQDEAAGFPAIR